LACNSGKGKRIKTIFNRQEITHFEPPTRPPDQYGWIRQAAKPFRQAVFLAFFVFWQFDLCSRSLMRLPCNSGIGRLQIMAMSAILIGHTTDGSTRHLTE